MSRPYIGGTNGCIKEVTAATTLSNADHGKIILMNAGSDNIVITLPALAKGLEFTFVQTKATAGSTCRITPVGGKIIGYVVQQEGENADATTADGLVSVLEDGNTTSATQANWDAVQKQQTADLGTTWSVTNVSTYPKQEASEKRRIERQLEHHGAIFKPAQQFWQTSL